MYNSRITRRNPAAFIILIDQSGSMQERILFGNSLTSKACAVATVTNNLISELIYRSHREDGVADYFDIAVYGYGGGGVRPMLGSRGSFIKISQAAALEVSVKESTVERVLDDGRRLMTAITERMWVTPVASGGTPMLGALDVAFRLISKWCARAEHRSAHPPVIFNITDGEATDGADSDLLGLAAKIKGVATDDGNALLFNIHIAASDSDVAVVFPSSQDDLPSHRYAGLLYDMSSSLPTSYEDAIRGSALSSGVPPYRCMSFNCRVTQLISMLDIGSVTVNSMG